MENFFFLLYLSLTAGYYFYLNNDKLHSKGYFAIFVVGIFFYVIFSSLYKMVDVTVKKYERNIQFKTLFTVKIFQIYMIIVGIVFAIYIFYPLRNLMR